MIYVVVNEISASMIFVLKMQVILNVQDYSGKK